MTVVRRSLIISSIFIAVLGVLVVTVLWKGTFAVVSGTGVFAVTVVDGSDMPPVQLLSREGQQRCSAVVGVAHNGKREGRFDSGRGGWNISIAADTPAIGRGDPCVSDTLLTSTEVRGVDGVAALVEEVTDSITVMEVGEGVSSDLPEVADIDFSPFISPHRDTSQGSVITVTVLSQT